MDKKGISEIKKTLKPERTAIDNIVTAFINHDENGAKITSYEKSRFLAMDEAAVFKYLDIVKSTFGGKFDKNLLNVGFPFKEEQDGGAQHKLMKLRESKLNDEELVREYIQTMADNFETGENLLITLVHGLYDVPTKTKDNNKVDESEEVFDFVIASICPMKLEKPGIYYNPKENKFEPITQKLVADKPVMGFMFPAFNDRQTDVHEMLFFAKKADDTHPEFINAVSGQKSPIPADVQKDIFENIIREVAGETTFDQEKDIHDKIVEMINTRTFDNKDTKVSKKEMFGIIKDCIPGENVTESRFNEAFNTALENYDASDFVLNNLIDANTFNVQMADVQIKVKPDRTESIEKKNVDGRAYFMIPVSGNVEINGKVIK